MNSRRLKILLMVLFGIFGSSTPGWTQDWAYSLEKVPESVRKNASVITHFENIAVVAETLEKIVVNVHRIFTVVNDDGKEALLFNEYTSKDVSLSDAEIRVFDERGKPSGKFRQKDMATQSTGEGLIEDGFVTWVRIVPSAYPVTIEVKYQQTIRSTLFFPGYRYINPRQGVVESKYSVRVPSGMGLRYKAKHSTIEPVITDQEKYKLYTWSVNNLSPLVYEEGAVAAISRYPHVKIVTDKFSHYGFDGDLSSWKSFGAWIKNLYEGLDVLSPERQQFFAQLTNSIPEKKDKIKRIYQYMQENFRYVSIQLGVGGLRPFSADFTDKKKYGDCKALSNYMRAALRSVGIISHVAIINAAYNQEPVDPEFPANEFNHVILCVPDQKDSIWLECTSATADFGELGTFTENRNALLITDDGGVLVPTPSSDPGTNTLQTLTKISMDKDLSGIQETVFTARGDYREILSDMMKESKERQKEELIYYFGFKHPDDFIFFEDASGRDKKTKLKMALTKIPEFNAGAKVFLSPRVYKMWSYTLPKSENRRLDFYFRFPFRKKDTTIIQLPTGFKLDVLPKNTQLTCAYGNYQSTYWYNEKENALYSATHFEVSQHKVRAIDYPMVKKFFDDIAGDHSQKVVVIKASE